MGLRRSQIMTRFGKIFKPFFFTLIIGFTGLLCPLYPVQAAEIVVNDYDGISCPNEENCINLREAIEKACTNNESDQIHFEYCGEDSKRIVLKSGPLLIGSCDGKAMSIDNTVSLCNDGSLDESLTITPDDDAVESTEGLIILNNSSKVTIKGLVFKNSPGSAIQLKGSSNKTVIEQNTLIDNSKGVELLGGSSSVDNKILNNKFDNRSTAYIVRTNASSNREANAPSELYAWIESNKLHVQGNLSKSGEWLIEVYVEDSDKKLYVSKTSFTATGTEIDKTWSSTLGLSKDDHLYVLAHYKSGDYYSTAPLSEAVSVDNEAPNFDQDGDGHNSAESGGDDCNDSDADIYPGKNESCDGKDNDCDTYTDEEVKTTYYKDADQDGYGSTAWTMACSPPAGFVTNDDDCNDSDASIHPGATEQCDGIDNNCDGSIDNARLCDKTLVIATADADGDGYFVNSPITENDCNDSDPAIYPGASEICDGVDNDCDSQVDENAVAEVCDSVDNNCDGQIDEGGICEDDADGDGYTETQGDCDDTNAAIHPGADEICEDGVDQDCDGDDMLCPICDAEPSFYRDQDGDGYGDPNVAADPCDDPPPGYVNNADDCDDNNSAIHPSATETCDDAVDQDCDGADSACPPPPEDNDQDDDGYIAVSAGGDDCDDSDAAIHPGSDEICEDGVDQDCDGDDMVCPTCNAEPSFYRDQDGDGYGDPNVAADPCDNPPPGYVNNADDCDDNNSAIHPSATETCDDAVDQDCDGTDSSCPPPPEDDDQDDDGYTAISAGGDDCNDSDPAINPAAEEIEDELDNNCDGVIDREESPPPPSPPKIDGGCSLIPEF